MRNVFFLIVFFVASFKLYSQGKQSYRLINHGNSNGDIYEKALAVASFDSLRYLDKSRFVPIVGTQFEVEIFSAQFLFDNYGKQISPLTVSDATNTRKIRFTLNEMKHLEIEK